MVLEPEFVMCLLCVLLLFITVYGVLHPKQRFRTSNPIIGTKDLQYFILIPKFNAKNFYAYFYTSYVPILICYGLNMMWHFIMLFNIKSALKYTIIK